MLSPAEPPKLLLEYCDSCVIGTHQTSMPLSGERYGEEGGRRVMGREEKMGHLDQDKYSIYMQQANTMQQCSKPPLYIFILGLHMLSPPVLTYIYCTFVCDFSGHPYILYIYSAMRLDLSIFLHVIPEPG